MTELWLIDQLDRTSGFSYIVTSQIIDTSSFTRDLENMGYRSVASVSDSSSNYLTRNDCAISIHLCESNEEPFTGGIITPQLSKKNLLGKIALATLLVGVAFVLMGLAFMVIVFVTSLVGAFGFASLAQYIGGMFVPAVWITGILGVILLSLLLALWVISHPAKRTVTTFKENLKIVIRNQIQDISINEFQIRPEPKAAKLDPEISRKLDAIRSLEPVDTYNRILEYITQY